jgi:hypothetical protein
MNTLLPEVLFTIYLHSDVLSNAGGGSATYPDDSSFIKEREATGQLIAAKHLIWNS